MFYFGLLKCFKKIKNFMKKSLLISLLIFTSFSFAQNSAEFLLRSKPKILTEINDVSNKSNLWKINYPGDPSIDVTYYKLNLKIETNPNFLKGDVTINGKANENLNSFFLDLQNKMKVDSVLSNGTKLQFNHENAKLNINLNQNYNPGEEFSVKIYYGGIPNSTGFGSFVFGTHGENKPAVWTLSEPYGTSDWLPCKDTPGDKADSSDVWITVSNNLYAVSNGSLIEIVNNEDNTSTFKWKNSYAIAQYLISLAIADYKIYKNYFHYSPTDSMPVINYVYPENFDTYKENLDKTPNMLKIFSNYFGQYSFINEKYGNAEFGWSGGGGMEHQTVSSLSDFSEAVIAHELAHQWFGDKITCRDWHHIWLNEGFATYGEALYAEALNGKSAYENFISIEMSQAKKAKGSIYVEDINSVREIFNNERSYSKGAVVLHMLRGVVGDSLFFKILKSYASDPAIAYGTAVTEDFKRNAEKVYGSDLSYFFNEWIYGVNYPRYRINWDSKLLSENNYEIKINVDQIINANPSFFTMPVQIQISTTFGDTLFSFFNDEQTQQVNFIVKGNPIFITLDPENRILKDAIIFQGTNGGSNLFSYKLEQNYPNPLSPFNPSTIINYEIPSSGNSEIKVQLKVFNILGKEVAVLVNETKPPGRYLVKFNSENLPSGVYFYRLQTRNYSQTKKLILIK